MSDLANEWFMLVSLTFIEHSRIKYLDASRPRLPVGLRHFLKSSIVQVMHIMVRAFPRLRAFPHCARPTV
jgi:hypothetical protein